jgi:4-amino-4-deoxy-L-arabinose transferase-like glycosyltransferase
VEHDPRDSRRRFWATALGLAAFKVAIHVALIGRFDYHRDELYFISCGKHLAFGYVDHPPLVPWIAALAGALFDHGLFGLR